eukprot:15273-Heterococcus_DN1.PRE.1
MEIQAVAQYESLAAVLLQVKEYKHLREPTRTLASAYREMKLEQKCKLPEERAAEADKKRRLDEEADAKAYLEPWQRPLQQICQGRGTSGLPPVAWEHIISFVSAIAPQELRGVAKVARDLASASATCTDLYCSVVGRWQPLSQFCIDQQLPQSHPGVSQQVNWERLLREPLRQSVTGLQKALSALQLRWPVAVPLALVWTVRAACAHLVRYKDNAARKANNSYKLNDYRAVLLQAGYGTLYDMRQQLEKLEAKAAYQAGLSRFAEAGPKCHGRTVTGNTCWVDRGAYCMKGMCGSCCRRFEGFCAHRQQPDLE